MTKLINYDKLYLDILKTGRDRVNTGLSYKDLQNILTDKGYNFDNDCIELAVKKWFYDSFYHIGQEDNPYNSFDDLEKHLDCNFILKADACLRLVEYDTTKRSTNAGIFSLIISLIAILYTVFHDLNDKEKQSIEQKELKKQIAAQQQALKEINQQLHVGKALNSHAKQKK